MPFSGRQLSKLCRLFSLMLLLPLSLLAQTDIYVNQVGYDADGPKSALIGTDKPLPAAHIFSVKSTNGVTAFKGSIGAAQQVNDWLPGKYFYKANFPTLAQPGEYTICTRIGNKNYCSLSFRIEPQALARRTLPSVLHYFRKQRANTPAELNADKKVKLYGSNQDVDLRGGWCDASGDVSKYFSHLAYANFMSPQQIPLVTWAMANADEAMPNLLRELAVKDSLEDEALWGADYLARSLSPEGYFYMIVFSYFKPDPASRRVVGLHANSVTTNEYQAAYREGGGMAIAALARISRWQKHGDYTNAQYLDAAKRAFAHLQQNNTRYDDDGKENIIDDYCALLAATELWIATNEQLYAGEARKRAMRLSSRMSNKGYFIADNGNRPFWHASDAGLPIIALARYLDKETNAAYREPALQTIKSALDYQLRITAEANNPFGYARQTFKLGDSIKIGFFIPHQNETGWWWQGENARLSSLAAAAIVGGRLAYPFKAAFGIDKPLGYFACNQLNWILGRNPYQMCFLYGFGKNNVPYMHSNFGHGSERGGISNGITGKDGHADGSGIDFKTEAQGNEWRWTEQWLPHAAWFLLAQAAMYDERR